MFNEIDLYIRRYPLNPKQLDKIIPVLYMDMDVTYKVIRILRDCIISNRVDPSDKTGLLKAVKHVLNTINDTKQEHISIEGCCLDILGVWNDSYVIIQLTKDIKNLERMKILKTYYQSQSLSKVIEHERKQLFDLERTFRKKHSDDTIMKNDLAVADIIK